MGHLLQTQQEFTMHVFSSPNSFGNHFLLDLGPRDTPNREAWATFNALRDGPTCLADHVYTPVHTPGPRATPSDHRFGEVILNPDPTPAVLSQVRRAYSNVPGARLHI
jgi:hypothetical protein